MKTTKKARCQIRAMEALLAFDKAMREGDLSIADLAQVIGAAVASGHDMMEIELSMAVHAVQAARDRLDGRKPLAGVRESLAATMQEEMAKEVRACQSEP